MPRVLPSIVALLLLVVSLAVQPLRARQSPDLPRTVILVSFDGFRWDYPARVPVRNLQRLIDRGVRAEALIPSFPSKTFPNHYSIVTGLYPGHHRIVANSILDERTGRTFAMSNRTEVQDAMWWGGEPIWVAAERAGRRTAPFFWVGSEAPVAGRRPTYWEPYDEALPPRARIARILGWLDLPVAERPTFLTLYFEDVDTAGHQEGPMSNGVRDAIARVDSYLGQLVAGLEERGILEQVNLVVVSDHGMSATGPDQVIVLDDYVSPDDMTIADINPTLGVFPKPGKADAVYRALRTAHPRLKMYRRDETPPHWHYRNDPRIPSIVGVADEGWQVLRRSTVADIAAGRTIGARGQHGYDPRVTSMRGLFVAAGPAFKRGATVRAFENVHVYNALARALDVTPSPNDGDLGIARSLMRP